MKFHHKHQARLLYLAGSMVLLCVACQNNPEHSSGGMARPAPQECSIDLATGTPSCTIYKSNHDLVVWINNSDGDLYVCGNPDPTKNPFEAYAWLVPKHNKRKSGEARDEVNPPATGQSVSFYTIPASPSNFCVWPQPSEGTKSNPAVIIKP